MIFFNKGDMLISELYNTEPCQLLALVFVLS